jgi:hypothetical protein
MRRIAAITVHRPRDEVQRLWREKHPADGPEVTFTDAPGDRGTEIRIAVEPQLPVGKLGKVAEKATTTVPLAKARDELRRFKQLVETGEIARSEGTPEGETAGRKLKQRPAQPLGRPEREKVGA